MQDVDEEERVYPADYPFAQIKAAFYVFGIQFNLKLPLNSFLLVLILKFFILITICIHEISEYRVKHPVHDNVDRYT